MVTVTLRPKQWLRVTGLPYRAGGGNYALLGSAIDASRSDQVVYSGGAFTMSGAHAQAVIHFLAEEFGQVHVVQHGGVTKCVSACWGGDPNTIMDCVCSCAGSNHGTKRAPGPVVADVGAAGELAVVATGPVEYDVLRGGVIRR